MSRGNELSKEEVRVIRLYSKKKKKKERKKETENVKYVKCILKLLTTIFYIKKGERSGLKKEKL